MRERHHTPGSHPLDPQGGGAPGPWFPRRRLESSLPPVSPRWCRDGEKIATLFTRDAANISECAASIVKFGASMEHQLQGVKAFLVDLASFDELGRWLLLSFSLSQKKNFAFSFSV